MDAASYVYTKNYADWKFAAIKIDRRAIFIDLAYANFLLIL